MFGEILFWLMKYNLRFKKVEITESCILVYFLITKWKTILVYRLWKWLKTFALSSLHYHKFTRLQFYFKTQRRKNGQKNTKIGIILGKDCSMRILSTHLVIHQLIWSFLNQLPKIISQNRGALTLNYYAKKLKSFTAPINNMQNLKISSSMNILKILDQ